MSKGREFFLLLICCLFNFRTMFVCYQVVHHNNGKDSSQTAYCQFHDLLGAMNFCDEMNRRNFEKNRDEQSIAITYYFQYV